MTLYAGALINGLIALADKHSPPKVLVFCACKNEADEKCEFCGADLCSGCGTFHILRCPKAPKGECSYGPTDPVHEQEKLR